MSNAPTIGHVPVLLKEVVEAFKPCVQKQQDLFTIVDGTLGGAGHAQALLEGSSNLKILACDIDQNAIENAKKSLQYYVQQGRLEFFHGNFSRLAAFSSHSQSIEPGFHPPWVGVLLDLGYSSLQLQDPQYGMSFMVDSKLDMRLSRPPQGPTAWEVLTTASVDELAEILKAYGEMVQSYRIAKKIKQAIEDGQVQNSTRSLALFLEQVLPRKKSDAIHPATLVFQALRIAVNDELRNLDHFLQSVILYMKASGRIAVITFHSLEDRLVKRWGQKNGDRLRAITKKPIVPQEGEIKKNPRSRSAKLRVYEKI